MLKGLANKFVKAKEQLSGQPAKKLEGRVDTVNFNGVARTNERILTHTIQPLFTSTTFDEIVKSAEDVRSKLESLGIFESVSVVVDTSTGRDATRNGYEITFNVQELDRLTRILRTQVSNNTCFLVVGSQLPNTFGNAENIRAEYGFGSKGNSLISLKMSKPLILDQDPVLSAILFKSDGDWPVSGFHSKDTGLIMDVTLNKGTKLVHNLQYELDWREVQPRAKYSSFEVRRHAGHSLKSSLRHIMTMDTRDESIFPTLGSLVKTRSEYAGIGGNINFAKFEVASQWNVPFWSPYLTFQFGATLGHTLKWGYENTIVDNFFLGGPHDLRGFESRSVGSKQDGNFTGGSTYCAGAIHMYSPIPYRFENGFEDTCRLHFWMNAGNCGEFLGKKSKNFLREARCSAGLGLTVKLGDNAKAEMNICWPLKASQEDSVIRGLQFGIGVHFL